MTHSHPHSPPQQSDTGPDMVAMLDLDADVSRPLFDELTGWLADNLSAPPRRIVDLGSGTGTGTHVLLARFPDAHVTALDSSTSMLERLDERVAELGLAEQVSTVRADLDEGVPVDGPVDLVWAASSMHHLGDPDRVLADVHALLAPGGAVIVVEAEDLPWFLPDDLGSSRPGLERRAHAFLDQHRADALPHHGSAWATRLAAAGFSVRAERVFEFHLPSPVSDLARRYAQTVLGSFHSMVGDQLDADDRATFASLLDSDAPESIARRTDLTVRSKRSAWIAGRTEK